MATTKPVRVLLADDTADLRDLMRVMLEASGGFVVIGEAADGAEAVRLAQQHQPDLAIVDVAMPVMGGLQAVPRIRSLSPNTLIAVLTVFERRDVEGQAIAAGADACMDKTRPPEELVAALAELTGAIVETSADRDSDTWATQALRESQAGFNDAFEVAAIGMAVTDFDGRPLRVNLALSRILARSPDELLRCRMWEWGSDHPTAPWDGSADPAREPATLEQVWTRPDGSSVWVTVDVAAVGDKRGRPLFLFCQIQDVTERHRAQAALRESEARFRGAWEASANGMSLISPAGITLMVNRRLCEMTGYSEEELVGRTFGGLAHPDDVDVGRAEVEACLAGRRDRWQLDKRYLRKDGSAFWVMTSGTVVRAEDGRPLFLTSEIHDLTGRMADREALADSEVRYRTLVEALDEGVLLISAEGRIVATNATAEQILGLTTEEILALGPSDGGWRGVREDGSPFPRWEQPIAMALRTGVEHRGIIGLVRSAGSHQWVSVTATPLAAPGETARGVVVSFTDVTATRDAELAIRESEARFRQLAEFSSDLIGRHLPGGEILYISPSCRRILGYGPELMVGRSWTDFIHPDDGELIPLHDAQQLDDVFTVRVRAADGQWVWLEVSRHFIRDSLTGTAIEVQTAARDVTERVALQSRLTNLALRDALTGLANRVVLMDRLGHALARRAVTGTPLSVLFVDLDNFKVVNDTHGHAVGDSVLVGVAQRLGRILRPADTAARLGGDEFVIVCEDLGAQSEAVTVATRVAAALSEPHEIGGEQIVVTASVGIAMAEPPTTADEILARADKAMYQAKQDGRACYRLAT